VKNEGIRGSLLAFRAFDNDKEIERLFDYEPTYSIIGAEGSSRFVS